MVRSVVRRSIAAAVLVVAVAPALQAQRGRARRIERRGAEPLWIAVTGGGSYALSDVEIVPGVDQNGGWSWDAGLRVGRGAGSLGVGYQRLRLDIGPEGAGTISAIYVEPRVAFGGGMRGVHPYVFARGARVFDYDVSFCCSVYPANSNANGWIAGGGFGIVFAPIGTIRFDLSAGVQRLSGESDDGDINGAWKGAGPMTDVRLGASIPLTRSYGMR